jgi:Cd2+/Zn2+-exporting ATPase
LRIARSLAARSRSSGSSKAAAAGFDGEPPATEGVSAENGRGVFVTIADADYFLGNHRWIEDRQQCSAELEALRHEHELQGRHGDVRG